MATRQTGKRAVALRADEPCPCCTAHVIVQHLLRQKVENAEGLPPIFEKQGSNGKVVIVDLGVAWIEHSIEPEGLVVHALGEIVMVAGNTIELTRGTWQGVLAAVATMLDARFGPLAAPGPLH